MRTVSACTLEYAEVPRPKVATDEAVVQIEHVTLCGTDLHIFEDDYTSELPLIQGHELSGTVVEVADDVAGVAVGDRVAVDPLIACGECATCRKGRGHVCPNLMVFGCYCDGGFVEYLSVSADRLHRIPDGLPTELGAVAEPTAISLESVTRGRAAPGETALVLGCGPIGALATLALHDLGATVIAADTVPDRLDLVREFGASHTLLVDAASRFPTAQLAEVLRDDSSDGPDLVIEATGVPASLANALDVVAPGGRVVQVGISTRPTGFPLKVIPFKEVELLGSRNSQGLIPEALKLIARHQDTVRSLLTHRFAVNELDQAFATMRATDQRVGKVLIDMPAKVQV
ncbi:MAG: zinc-dependent alcohol dehydrogenase [Nocardioides sp.]|uniref:zinc-dependent alcohol dehydrogenase n=1 Tax=Nocardioides sp. TaxID=35761 RepID=UPI003D6C1159